MGDKQTPNEIYKSCLSVERLVKDRYRKYLELIQENAPHLMLETLSIASPQNNVSNVKPTASSLNTFASGLRDSLPSSPKSDALYKKHMGLRKYSFGQTPKRIGDKLAKYEKRLNYARHSSLKPIKKYNYKQFVSPKPIKSATPRAHTLTFNNQTTRIHSPTHSPNKENFKKSMHSSPYLSRLREKRQEYNQNNVDVSNFKTKVQITPCKSSKNTQKFKKFTSRQQQSTELEFKRTPGFQTIKRRDRRRAARFDTTPYKPPKKPADFVQFSPEKQVDAILPIQQNSSIPVLEKKEEKKMTVPLTPNVNKKKNKFENKPSLDLQPTVPITPPSKPQVAVSSNNILGLTSTPPPLLQQQKEEKTENEKEAASNVWKWGSNDG